MREHTITVDVTDTTVLAEDNPLGANPGDTVVWQWDAATAASMGKNLQVVFREIELADGTIEPCGPSGPFSELSRSAERVVGIVSFRSHKGRYLYDVFHDSKKLNWLNPLPPGKNFGGLDVPPPPPRG